MAPLHIERQLSHFSERLLPFSSTDRHGHVALIQRPLPGIQFTGRAIRLRLSRLDQFQQQLRRQLLRLRRAHLPALAAPTRCYGKDLASDPVGALVGLALMLAGDRMAWRRGVFHCAIMDGFERDAWSRSTPSMSRNSSFVIGQYGR